MSSSKIFPELPENWLPHRASERLKFEPPFDWLATLHYLAPRCIPGVEAVGENTYSRTLSRGGTFGLLRVTGDANESLHVELATSAELGAAEVVRSLRRLFDLDADPDAISRHFAKDK